MGVPKPIYEEIIIKPEDIVPSEENMEVIAVCNPGGTLFHDKDGEKFFLLLRVLEKTNNIFSKHIAYPKAIKGKDKKYMVRWGWERIGRDVHSDDSRSLVTLEPEERVKPTYISLT